MKITTFRLTRQMSKKIIVDPSTQFSNIKAITILRKEEKVLLASQIVKNTRWVNIATGKALTSVEYGLAYYFEYFLLEFKI